MPDDPKTEIRDKDTFLEKDTNDDGSKIKEVVEDGDVIAEIRNKDTFTERDTNPDGSPIQVVVSKK